MRRRSPFLVCLIVLLGFSLPSSRGAASQLHRPGSWAIDPRGRQAALDFYRDQYAMNTTPAMDWTGTYDTCDAGTINPDYQAATLRRINYYRAMAGLELVALDATYSAKAQQSALMTSINGQLNHSPPSAWLCYTVEGGQASGKSNMAFGNGWIAINRYMQDPGSGNASVGHRGWLLHPPTQRVGVGDVPGRTGNGAANTTWIWDEHLQDPAVPTRDACVAWPPAGYVPYTVVWPRWSCAIADADMSNASVSMTENGVPISLAVDHRGGNGTRMNTIVWRPSNLSHAGPWPRPTQDMTYTVTINNVIIGGQSQTVAYTTTVMDLNQAPTGLQLTPAAALLENQPVGTPVGTLSATDADAGDTITYQLVAGAGDTDNGRFSIAGTTLLTDAVLNYEAQATYSIRLRARDQRGAFVETAVQLELQDVSEAPTAISLSSATIDEILPPNERIGTLLVSDDDAHEQHTLSLVSGPGDADNAAFRVISDTLVTNAVFDYEAQSVYQIRVQATDQAGLSMAIPLIVMINDRNEAPIFETMPISTTVATGRVWSKTFVARDVDLGDQLTFATAELPPWAAVITSTTSSTGEASITITGTPDAIALWDATLIVQDRQGMLGFLAVRLQGYEAKRYFLPVVAGPER